jgi:hypothetical protein
MYVISSSVAKTAKIFTVFGGMVITLQLQSENVKLAVLMGKNEGGHSRLSDKERRLVFMIIFLISSFWRPLFCLP